MKDRILRAHRLVEWLEFEESPFDDLMGEDRNDVLDWDNNNIE